MKINGKNEKGMKKMRKIQNRKEWYEMKKNKKK